MHPILVLLRKDFAYLRRDRASIALTFIVPFVLIYIFGLIFAVNQTHSGPSALPLAVVNDSADPSAAALVEALGREKTFRLVRETAGDDGVSRSLREADLRPLMRADRFRFAVVLPSDFSSSERFGARLKFFSNPRNQIETQTVTGVLQKTIFTAVPQLLGRSLQNRARQTIGEARTREFNRGMAGAISGAYGGDQEAIYRGLEAGNFGIPSEALDGSAGGSGVNVFSQLVQVDEEQVLGADVRSPQATQLVGGWAMQFLLFAVAASATSLFYEKEHGLFLRLLAAPVRRSDILWSKFLYGVGLGLLQLVVLFTAGRVLYGIDIEHHLPLLLLVCGFAAAACSAFGMLLAALARTPEAARGMATFVILLMSAIGGAWFPVSMMPAPLQQVSKFTLVYWSMEGFAQVLWAHVALPALLPTLGALAAMTAVVLAVAWWRFNRGPIFG